MVIPGLANLAAAGVDTAVQMIGQNKANRENRRAARRERQWNEAMWHKQNAYNHPAEQMARLQEAGLNPHLIYGSGTGTAAGNAGDVKGYSRAESQSVTKGFDMFQRYNQFHNLQAQTDNLRAQEQVNEQEAVKKSYETLATAVDIDRKKFDLGLSKELRQTSVKAAQSNAEQALQNARRATAEADVSVNTRDPRIREAQQKVNYLVENVKGQKLINELNALERDLNKLGIQKNDNVFLRLLMRSRMGSEAVRNFMDANKWQKSKY